MRKMWLAAALMLAGCAPPIELWGYGEELDRKFPPGANGQILYDELVARGFKFHEAKGAHFSAYYPGSDCPYGITWEQDAAKKIKRIKRIYVCPML